MFIIFFTVLTLAVLVTGISLMATGGKLNKKYGNKLMMLRVILQATALVALILLFVSK